MSPEPAHPSQPAAPKDAGPDAALPNQPGGEPLSEGQSRTATPIPPPQRRGLVGVAVLASLAGLGWSWWRERSSDKSTRAGAGTGADQRTRTPADAALDVFWQAQFDTPGGQKLLTNSFKNRPLLINFWATWCPPCIEELPLIEAFYRQNSSNGWQVLGIAADKPEAVNRFLTQLPLSFPLAIAGLEGVALSRSLGNLAGGLPFTVVLGRDGRVIQRKMGQIRADDLKEWAALR